MRITKIILAVFTASFFLSGCATVTPHEQISARQTLRERFHYGYSTHGDFADAIAKDNVEAVRLFMQTTPGFPYFDEQENSFWRPDSALKLAVRHPKVLEVLLQSRATDNAYKQQIWMEAADPQYFVNSNGSVCIDPQTIAVLLKDAGAPEKPAFMANRLSDAKCTDSLKLFLGKFPNGADEPRSEAFQDFRLNLKRLGNEADNKRFSEFSEVLAVLNDAAKVGCDKGSLAACKAMDTYAEWVVTLTSGHAAWLAHHEEAAKAVADSVDANAKYALYKASAQSSFDNACRSVRDVQLYQKIVNDEKRVGAETGVVNKVELYSSGRSLIGAKEFLERMKIEYKQRSGRSFNPESCASRETHTRPPADTNLRHHRKQSTGE